MQDNNITPIVKLEYNIANDEENIAFKEFQKKFVLKGNIIKTIIFVILLALFADQVIRQPDYTLGWGMICVIVIILFVIWYNPIKIRKNLIKALKEVENDTHKFELYPDYFTITTFCNNENSETISLSEFEKSQENEEDEDDPKVIGPITVNLDSDLVSAVEIEELIAVFVKKQTNYVLPKRVISNAHLEEIRKVFKEKLGNNFVIKKC